MFEAEAPYRIVQVASEPLDIPMPAGFDPTSLLWTSAISFLDGYLIVMYTAADLTCSFKQFTIHEMLTGLREVDLQQTVESTETHQLLGGLASDLTVNFDPARLRAMSAFAFSHWPQVKPTVSWRFASFPFAFSYHSDLLCADFSIRSLFLGKGRCGSSRATF